MGPEERNRFGEQCCKSPSRLFILSQRFASVRLPPVWRPAPGGEPTAGSTGSCIRCRDPGTVTLSLAFPVAGPIWWLARSLAVTRPRLMPRTLMPRLGPQPLIASLPVRSPVVLADDSVMAPYCYNLIFVGTCQYLAEAGNWLELGYSYCRRKCQ